MTERTDEIVIDDDTNLHWYCVGFQYMAKGKLNGFGNQSFGFKSHYIRDSDLNYIKKTITKQLIDEGLTGVDIIPLSISFLGVMTEKTFRS
jgi:hypothetical protein